MRQMRKKYHRKALHARIHRRPADVDFQRTFAIRGKISLIILSFWLCFGLAFVGCPGSLHAHVLYYSSSSRPHSSSSFFLLLPLPSTPSLSTLPSRPCPCPLLLLVLFLLFPVGCHTGAGTRRGRARGRGRGLPRPRTRRPV
jgi:hypothetical protein